ncbi:MAG: hypothetical protein FWG03_10880, partial [Clostridiales bacterium]|nr:hypothetical protein [Clostridiales bacterium]
METNQSVYGDDSRESRQYRASALKNRLAARAASFILTVTLVVTMMPTWASPVYATDQGVAATGSEEPPDGGSGSPGSEGEGTDEETAPPDEGDGGLGTPGDGSGDGSGVEGEEPGDEEPGDGELGDGEPGDEDPGDMEPGEEELEDDGLGVELEPLAGETGTANYTWYTA